MVRKEWGTSRSLKLKKRRRDDIGNAVGMKKREWKRKRGEAHCKRSDDNGSGGDKKKWKVEKKTQKKTYLEE